MSYQSPLEKYLLFHETDFLLLSATLHTTTAQVVSVAPENNRDKKRMVPKVGLTGLPTR